MNNTDKTEERTWNDILLSVDVDGYKILKNIIITVAIIYIAISPQSAAVFIEEYFKLDPTITFTILMFALPLLVSISLTRSIIINCYFTRQWITMLFITLLLPIFILLRFMSQHYISVIMDKLFDFMKKVEIPTDSKKLNNIRRWHLITTVILMLFLFVAQFHDNAIGRLWNPQYNEMMKLKANLHYYCQVTGNYNNEECQLWKAQMEQYKQKRTKTVTH